MIGSFRLTRNGLLRQTANRTVNKVTTLVGPGELIDVVVTERGIAINPRCTDLIDAIKSSGSKLPIRTIQEAGIRCQDGGWDKVGWDKVSG